MRLHGVSGAGATSERGAIVVALCDGAPHGGRCSRAKRGR